MTAELAAGATQLFWQRGGSNDCWKQELAWQGRAVCVCVCVFLDGATCERSHLGERVKFRSAARVNTGFFSSSPAIRAAADLNSEWCHLPE